MNSDIAVFVLSADHSGSTWVGYVLGSHSQSAFLGEFYRGWDDGLRQPCATCLERGRDSCELLHGVTLVPAEQAYEWAFRRTGKKVLVDTSKVTDWPLRATASLKRPDIRLVHLLRDPRGWFASRRRRIPSLDHEAALKDWKSKNEAIRAFARDGGFPCVSVLYEDLAIDPEGGFRKLFRSLDLHFEREALAYWNKPHHGFAANGATSMLLASSPENVHNAHFRTGDDDFYRRARKTVFLDQRWRRELSVDLIERISSEPGAVREMLRFGKLMIREGLADNPEQDLLDPSVETLNARVPSHTHRDMDMDMTGTAKHQRSSVSPRTEFLRSMLPLDGEGLEIGPSYNPLLPKEEGFRVKTVDYTNQMGLRAKYKENPHVDLSRIETVDYVLSESASLADAIAVRDLSYIVASHVIEHTPDLLGFLQSCEALLAPRGVLLLAVPDKRHCFDVLQSLTSTGAVLQAHLDRRVRPSPGTVFDEVAYNAIRGGAIGWSPQNREPLHFFASLDHASFAYRDACENPTYHDVHVWRFVPSSFRLIVRDLNEIGLIGLSERSFHDSVGNEFYVTLSPSGTGCPIDRLSLARQALREQASIFLYADEDSRT